ncbi:ABC transporter substrate-binding protein [Agromyces archimandritae]|uniref:ABC transporter substrate-binding protein n=1 Tax=Agromyces archimandritae TaxID=2781962 RepID=A0A975IMR7_9MICO|nr:ABC transporter substrate-binding protein [Agromyces archimandritae]QTX03817.1 ABC transporter substrate-binding protein [Agromyces archimandritae]
MKHTLRTLAVAAAAVLALSGCTDSDAGGSAAPSDGGGELTPITVGLMPVADTAALYLGESLGYFEDAGLDLTIETATGGAAIAPAVVAGDYQFGFSNMLSLMVANEKGLGLKSVSAAVATTGDTSADMGAVIVTADSPIQSPADLAGKKISSNTVGNINEVVTRAAIDAAGGDGSTAEFVEVAFPDTIAAVENGQVDAGFVVEPFVTAALEAGDRVVSYAYAEFDDSLDIASYFTTAAYADENPEIVEAFQQAMAKSLKAAQDDSDAVRDIIGTYTKTDAEVLAKMVLPKYPSEIDRDAAAKLGDDAVKYGALTAAPDLDALLP